MKLSIWPKANAHPRNKEEKVAVGYQVSGDKNLPTTVEFNDDEELLQFVTSNAWSPFVFSGKRHADNFISCDLLVYDIDDGLTIDKAQALVEKLELCCLCLPSPSHTEELHKFRIIMPLAYTITNPEVYIATWLAGAELFGVVDEQCKDLARFYNSSTQDDGFWNEGKLFEPRAAEPIKLEHSLTRASETMLPVSGDINEIVEAIYGEKRSFVPEAVDFFIRNAHSGLPGQWNDSLNRFCFSLALSNVEECTILTVCEQLAPQELDKKDLYQIKRAVKDAKQI